MCLRQSASIGVEPAVGQQLPLFVPQAARTARLGWQLARLALTFGEDRIRRVAISDPEAVRLVQSRGDAIGQRPREWLRSQPRQLRLELLE